MSTKTNANLEDITSSGNIVIASKLAIGASVEGKLVGLEQNRNYPDNKNLLLEDTKGSTVTLLTSGNLNYAIKDGKFEIGRYYVITRKENKLVKGKSSTQFQIQRLREDGTVAAPKENNTKPAGRNSLAK